MTPHRAAVESDVKGLPPKRVMHAQKQQALANALSTAKTEPNGSQDGDGK